MRPGRGREWAAGGSGLRGTIAAAGLGSPAGSGEPPLGGRPVPAPGDGSRVSPDAAWALDGLRQQAAIDVRAGSRSTPHAVRSPRWERTRALRH
jgi:hypothetical protein